MHFLFAWLILLLVASTSGQDFTPTGTYNVQQSVQMLDESDDPVGYQISSKLIVTPKGPNVYLFKLKDVGLHIMSRKAPTPHGFIPHSSKLESAHNDDFIVVFNSGLIKALHLSDADSVSMRNIKRAIAGAFQFKSDSKDGVETDASGKCKVRYEKLTGQSTSKFKTECKSSSDFNFSTDIWGGKVESESVVKLTYDERNNGFSSILSSESHDLQSHLADFIIARVKSSLSIDRTSSTGESGALDYTGTSEDIVADILIEIGGKYTEYDLTLEPLGDQCLLEKCPLLEDVVKESKSNLVEYGSAKAAMGVLNVANAMRRSNQQQIHKVLNSKENKKILGVLLDIAGSVQTFDSHQAVLKKLRLNTEKYNLDNCERYFWALSVYPNPSYNITKEVVEIVKQKHHDIKLFQTLLQTAAAMVHKLTIVQNEPNHQLMEELVETMKEELDNCDSDDELCRQQYLSALGQTSSVLALPILIKYATTSTLKSGVTSLKGIQKIGKLAWTPEVILLAERVLLSNVGFDSSAKTIALDILVSQNPSDHCIRKMLSLLPARKNKEVNQMILQKLTHRASKCEEFSSRLDKLLKEETTWNSLAQGGLSTSFSRSFMDKGFLSTDQEISSGILKRGLVHVNLIHNNTVKTPFTLGLFSSGLGSFVSSNDEAGSDEDEEATAGMQIQVLGVEFRPFVFFTGSGDLMGHVWSGTASTETPAYQAGLVISRSENKLPLGPSGGWADMKLEIASSLELAGLIEISLWNRNAHSSVFNRLGLSLAGGIKVNNEFVKTKVDLHLTAEPSLDLTSQIDFSSAVSLCLKLYQPSTVIRYNTYKVERIEGSKHKLRKSRYSSRPVPGRTYALNQKNNDMCNAIHKQ